MHLFLASPLGTPAKHFLSFQSWLFLLRKSGGDSSRGQGEYPGLHRLSVPFKRERGKEAKQQSGSGVVLAGMRTGLLGYGLCTNEMHLLVPKHPCTVLE